MTYASRGALIFWPEQAIETQFKTLAKKPLGVQKIADSDTTRSVIISLDGVKQQQNLSLLLAGMNKGIFSFTSKEKSQSRAPYLIASNGNGETLKITAAIDTYIQKGVRKEQGFKDAVQVGNGRYGLLSFQIPPENLENFRSFNKWKLVLEVSGKQFGDTSLHVSQLALKIPEVAAELDGLAKLYPNDTLINSHSSVYFADSFDDATWFKGIKAKFGLIELPWGNRVKFNTISHEDVGHFLQSEGASAIAPFRTTQNLALNLEYPFKQKLGYEPEEAYFRYYLKLAKNAVFGGGGKLPGFAGTYGKAGWGGRGNTGNNGWSARGAFFDSIKDKNSPWAGRMPIGQYVYQVDKDKYGKTLPWGHDLSTIEPGRWYCIEQHIKLNTPGKANALLEVWVDGIKIYRKDNLYFRDTEKLKIEKVWLNFYFGGVAKPTRDFDMYVDNVVIASQYIGPVSVN